MMREVCDMGIRMPARDGAPPVAFEDAVQLVFEALGDYCRGNEGELTAEGPSSRPGGRGARRS